MKRTNQPKGKTAKSLDLSRKVRADFLYKMGIKEMPHSILYHERSVVATDLLVEEEGRSYTGNMHDELKPLKSKTLKNAFSSAGKSVRRGRSYNSFSLGDMSEDRRQRDLFAVSGMSCRSGGLSRFSQNVGKLIVQFYCPEGGIVYDPFAGHNSRMELVSKTGRSYVGVDVSHEFMEANRELQKTLIGNDGKRFCLYGPTAPINLIEGSSAKVDLPNDYADFTITSPPYWDLEYYGEEPEQLGRAKTYESFLEFLLKHIEENYRILKPGAFCAWFVNDFTKNGIFYPYHVDLCTYFKKAGFEIHNVYIVDLGQPIAAAFVRTMVSSKRFPKRHEYCIMARKPGKNVMVEEHFKLLTQLTKDEEGGEE